MTWVHILMEIGSYGLAMAFGMIAWAKFDAWLNRLAREEASDFELEHRE